MLKVYRLKCLLSPSSTVGYGLAITAPLIAHAYLKYPTLAPCARDDVLFEHLDNVKRVREGDDSVEVGVVEMKSTR
jgi:hypothetical protein